MKKVIILSSILLLFFAVSSCETQAIDDETGTEIKDTMGTDKNDTESPGSGGDEPIEQ